MQRITFVRRCDNKTRGIGARREWCKQTHGEDRRSSTNSFSSDQHSRESNGNCMYGLEKEPSSNPPDVQGPHWKAWATCGETQLASGGWAVALPLQPYKPSDPSVSSKKILRSPTGTSLRSHWHSCSWLLGTCFSLVFPCCPMGSDFSFQEKKAWDTNPSSSQWENVLGWNWLWSGICRKQHQQVVSTGIMSQSVWSE